MEINPVATQVTAVKWSSYIIGGLLVTTLILLLALFGYGQYRANKSKDSTIISAEADKAAAETHSQGTATYIIERDAAHEATSEALAQHPEVAAVVIPADVADRLRDRSGSE